MRFDRWPRTGIITLLMQQLQSIWKYKSMPEFKIIESPQKNRESWKSRLLWIPWNVKIWVPSLTLATYAHHYLSFVALGMSAGTVFFSGAIKANTQAMINNNTTINNLLKSLKINMTVPLLDNTPTTPTPAPTPSNN